MNEKQHVTRYAMLEAGAMKRDPKAARMPGTREVREVPETPAELAALSHADMVLDFEPGGGGCTGPARPGLRRVPDSIGKPPVNRLGHALRERIIQRARWKQPEGQRQS